MRRTLAQLTTRRLDGRSAVAGAIRRWKAEITADLGGDLTRAQDTLLEMAAQAWVILQALDDYILRQPTLVTKKRQVVGVVMQRMQIVVRLERLSDVDDRLARACLGAEVVIVVGELALVRAPEDADHAVVTPLHAHGRGS